MDTEIYKIESIEDLKSHIEKSLEIQEEHTQLQKGWIRAQDLMPMLLCIVEEIEKLKEAK